MRAWIPAILAAAVLHAAILLFGGIFFLDSDEESAASVVEQVDLLTVEDEPEEQQEDLETAPEPPVPEEPPPEMSEIADTAREDMAEDVVPRLDALSLAALSAALDGATGGSGAADGFGGSLSLASGGRIGGTGLPGTSVVESAADLIFDIGQLDQRPRAVQQTAPVYPRELRQRKIEGTVYVVFVVDRDGRVLDPKVEQATHEEFSGPALAAVRRWRFEPAVLRGEKVRSKLRVPIRFALSS